MRKQNFFCLAGGTGLTPIWQVIEAICKNNESAINIKLILGNKTPEDILLKKELDEYALNHPNFTMI